MQPPKPLENVTDELEAAAQTASVTIGMATSLNLDTMPLLGQDLVVPHPEEEKIFKIHGHV